MNDYDVPDDAKQDLENHPLLQTMKDAGIVYTIDPEEYTVLRFNDDVVDLTEYSIEQYNDPMVRTFEKVYGTTSKIVKETIVSLLKDNITKYQRRRSYQTEMMQTKNDLSRINQLREEFVERQEKRLQELKETLQKSYERRQTNIERLGRFS